MLAEHRKFKFDASRLIKFYHNSSRVEFKKVFEEFVNDYYYNALENIEKTNDKELIMYFTEIINTYNIFNALLSFEDDYEIITKIINKKPLFFKFLSILYSYNWISHRSVALRLNIHLLNYQN